ncbi:MAG: pentapeptide repeat-containing protein [Acaryochloridaceae cyanobacterium RU_4_10]|nr:pentapeptide repeat-containing protein [Acaryochloridaceae cyanobacterium RU_4_10]
MFSHIKPMKLHHVLILTLLAGTGAMQISHSADRNDLRRLLQTGKCERCNLVGADLRNANLRNANLKHANLKNANLTGANLQDANFHGANLRYSSLKNAVIQDTDFSEANLQGATLNYRELDRGDAKVCNAIMPNGVKKETNFDGFFGFGGCRH